MITSGNPINVDKALNAGIIDRATIQMLVVEGWAQLMDLMLDPDDFEVTATKKT